MTSLAGMACKIPAWLAGCVLTLSTILPQSCNLAASCQSIAVRFQAHGSHIGTIHQGSFDHIALSFTAASRRVSSIRAESALTAKEVTSFFTSTFSGRDTLLFDDPLGCAPASGESDFAHCFVFRGIS
jgi:hypothetical protein